MQVANVSQIPDHTLLESVRAPMVKMFIDFYAPTSLGSP